jgi:hypothetical protein
VRLCVQCEGDRSTDKESDVWERACVVYDVTNGVICPESLRPSQGHAAKLGDEATSLTQKPPKPETRQRGEEDSITR